MPKNLTPLVAILIVLAILFGFKTIHTNKVNSSKVLSASKTQTPKPSPTPSSTIQQNQSSFSSQITISQSNITSSGQTSQISCTFSGSVKITSSWSNLTLGKNGSSKLDLCVSVNGNNTLVSSDNHQSGSRTDTYSNISSSSYSFSLYDAQGGDIPDCSGTPLSSCQINSTNTNPAPNPLPPLNSRSI